MIFIAFSVNFFFQSFPGPSLESEDFNIPPITPPSLPDHSLVHLNEIESGYHSLCHPMNHNGLLPFHPQNMDLPEITVSNMLGQDGALLSNSLSVVSIFSLSLCTTLSYEIVEIQTCLKSSDGPAPAPLKSWNELAWLWVLHRTPYVKSFPHRRRWRFYSWVPQSQDVTRCLE